MSLPGRVPEPIEQAAVRESIATASRRFGAWMWVGLPCALLASAYLSLYVYIAQSYRRGEQNRARWNRMHLAADLVEYRSRHPGHCPAIADVEAEAAPQEKLRDRELGVPYFPYFDYYQSDPLAPYEIHCVGPYIDIRSKFLGAFPETAAEAVLRVK